MEMIWQFGEPWRDLAPEIQASAHSGATVVWMSMSGTFQLITRAPDDPWLARTRVAASNHHAFDGLPLIVQEPLTASPCGMGDASGYRSTPPLLVARVSSPDGLSRVGTERDRLVEAIKAGAFEAVDVPAGHPEAPCPAMYCLWRSARVSGAS